MPRPSSTTEIPPGNRAFLRFLEEDVVRAAGTKSATGIGRALGMTEGAIRNWRNGVSGVTLDSLQKLAALTGRSVDELRAFADEGQESQLTRIERKLDRALRLLEEDAAKNREEFQQAIREAWRQARRQADTPATGTDDRAS